MPRLRLEMKLDSLSNPSINLNVKLFSLTDVNKKNKKQIPYVPLHGHNILF